MGRMQAAQRTKCGSRFGWKLVHVTIFTSLQEKTNQKHIDFTLIYFFVSIVEASASECHLSILTERTYYETCMTMASFYY